MLINHPATYTFKSTDGDLNFQALAGETGPIITDGVTSTIEAIGRPNRDALTIPTGSSPLQMDVPILLEGFDDGGSNPYVEDAIYTLQYMAGYTGDSQGINKPYAIKLHAPGNLNPFPTRIWWISGLTYGDHIYNSGGYRIRQEITVQLTEKISDRGLSAKSLKQLIKKKAPLRVKAKKGETLRKVIRRIYPKANTREIKAYIAKAKKMNPGLPKDADKKFEKAIELILPPRGSIDKN